MTPPVQIRFDCIPLRSVPRLDVPLDASPEYRERCLRIQEAMRVYGDQNAYYLVNGQAVFHLTNSDVTGMLRFEFEGIVLADASDAITERVEVQAHLVAHTCDWLTKPAETWFHETVRRAVAAEFDRHIATGQRDQAAARIEAYEGDGFLGMFV